MSFSIDKQWMKESDRRTTQYVKGVQKFIDFVVENGGNKEIYSCPCKQCKNMKMKIKLDDIHYHLLRWGIVQSYTMWHFHGEELTKKQKQPVSHAISTDDSDEKDLSLDEDILSPVLGKGKSGRTRSIETKILRTQVKASTIARKQLKKGQGDFEELIARMDKVERTLKTLVDLFKGYMDQRNHILDIASDVGGSSTRQGSVGSMLNNDVADQLNSPSADDRKCEILNFDLDVIATAFVCRDSTSIMHEKPIPPTHEKLVLDNILLPDEKTTKPNHPLAMTFAEVGIGGYVYHPKNAIRYL